MLQQQAVRFLCLPLMLVLSFAIADPAMAMGGGSMGKSDAKAGKMEDKKGHDKKGGMHGSMGLSMTNVMPGKTLMFLDHFKKWIEITPEQQPAWGAFSKAIKLQATHKRPMRHMMMMMSPVQMAEAKIARTEQMVQLKKNTLKAFKALLEVLDEQQVQLANAFLAKHMMMHKGKGMKKGGH